jgi:hypothetical protein
MSLPGPAIIDLMKQWNRRPLQVGSDLIRANFYRTEGGSAAADLQAAKRRQDNAATSAWHQDTVAQRYRMEAASFY